MSRLGDPCGRGLSHSRPRRLAGATVVAGALCAVLSSAAVAGGAATPIYGSGGPYYTVDLRQSAFSKQLAVNNLGDETIQVTYSDPTYGSQTRTISSGRGLEGAPMCADAAYQYSNPVLVTFHPGTPNETTGKGWFKVYDDTPDLVALQQAVATFTVAHDVAKAELRKARKHHRPAKIRRAKKHVTSTSAQVNAALSDLAEAQHRPDYCAARKLS